MKLTDSDKEMLEDLGTWFSSNPEYAVEQGLRASYLDDESERPLIAFSHRIFKEVILRVIKKRNIEVDENEQFLINDETVVEDNKTGISVEQLKDLSSLKNILKKKQKICQ